MVKERRKWNKIGNFQREDESWTINDKETAQEITAYYEQLFKSSRSDCLDDILDGIPRTISDQINKNLTRPVEENEIKIAVFSMNPNKAPGPDGMTPFFFQKLWNVVKKKVVKAIKSFFFHFIIS